MKEKPNPFPLIASAMMCTYPIGYKLLLSVLLLLCTICGPTLAQTPCGQLEDDVQFILDTNNETPDEGGNVKIRIRIYKPALTPITGINIVSVLPPGLDYLNTESENFTNDAVIGDTIKLKATFNNTSTTQTFSFIFWAQASYVAQMNTLIPLCYTATADSASYDCRWTKCLTFTNKLLHKLDNIRFTIGSSHSLSNKYPEFGWNAYDSPSTFFLNETAEHMGHAPAMRKLGSYTYYRGGKTNALIRTQFCETSIQTHPDSLLNFASDNPVIYGTGYFNWDFYNASADNQCIENEPGELFIKPIVDAAHQEEATLGLYIKIFEDYFYEIQHGTGAYFDTATLIFPSRSLCRRQEDYLEPIFPNGVIASDLMQDSTLPQILFEAGGDFVTGSTLFDTIHPHYLCPSALPWQEQCAQRLKTFAANGADFMFFDETHMPEEGCFCHWCRRLYADNNQQFFENFVGEDEPIFGNTLQLAQQRRLQDFKHDTQMKTFEKYLDMMHGSGPNPPYGTLGIVSIGGLSELSSDEYRTAFAHLVDIPKTEWYIPIRAAANISFFGDFFNASDSSTFNYRSILADYRIPEATRLAGAYSMLRDVSKYGRSFIWIPYTFAFNDPSDPNVGNHSVRNNQRMKTLLGSGYTQNAMSSTSLFNYIQLDSTATDGVRFKDKAIWDMVPFADDPDMMVVPNDASTASHITDIFVYDKTMSRCLAGKKAIPYVAGYFSEEERNRYLFMGNNLEFDVLTNQLPLPNGVTQQTTSGVGIRTALAWWHHLMPWYGAFEAIHHAPVLLTDTVGFRFPITVTTDWMIAEQDLKGARAVLIPRSTGIGTTAINYTGNVNLENNIDALPVPSIDVLRNDALYRLPPANNPTLANNILIAQHQFYENVRNTVVATVGLPDIYITSHTPNAHQVVPGFYTNDDHSQVAIPLSLQPMYGIPRTYWDKNPVAEVPLNNLDTLLYAPDVYDTEPLVLEQNGAILIHLRMDNNSDYFTGDLSDYEVRAISSDPGLPVTYLDIDEVDGEYIIKVPTFSCFMMIMRLFDNFCGT